MKHYFDSVTPYYLSGKGNLGKYPNNTICIKGNRYSVDNEPFQRIRHLERLKDDDEGFVLKDKHVFRIRQQDQNNNEICIKLDWYHALLLRSRFVDYQGLLNNLTKHFIDIFKQSL